MQEKEISTAGSRQKEPRQFRRIQVLSWGPELVVTHRWFRWRVLPGFVFFTYVAVAFLAHYVNLVARLANGDQGAEAIVPLLVYLAPTVIVVSIAYGCFAMLVNRSVIRVTTSDFSVRHGPVPWWGGRDFASDEVECFFCRGPDLRLASNYRDDGDHVFVKLNDGRKHPLVRRLKPEEADFLTQTLSKALDTPICSYEPR